MTAWDFVFTNFNFSLKLFQIGQKPFWTFVLK